MQEWYLHGELTLTSKFSYKRFTNYFRQNRKHFMCIILLEVNKTSSAVDRFTTNIPHKPYIRTLINRKKKTHESMHARTALCHNMFSLKHKILDTEICHVMCDTTHVHICHELQQQARGQDRQANRHMCNTLLLYTIPISQHKPTLSLICCAYVKSIPTVL